MKRALFTAIIAILTLKLGAQTANLRLDTAIYVVVDSVPKFPGGLKALRRYIDANVNNILKKNHPTGTIIAEVQIEKDGKIKNTPGIVDGLPGETDSVVINLLKNTVTWKPGIKNGKPVRTLLRIPITIHDSMTVNGEQSLNAENASELEDELMISEPKGSSDEYRDDDPFKIYTSVDHAPEFPGGKPSFDNYIKENVKLKETSKTDYVKVMVSFIVERDGSLTNIKIAKGFSNVCNNEALRLLQQSPKWSPGRENGRVVRTAFSVTVYFKPTIKDHLY